MELEIVSLVLILVISIFLILYISKTIKDKKIILLFIYVFIFKLIFLLVDKYVIGLPFSAGDAQVFERTAWDFAKYNITPRHTYSLIIGIIYKVIGRQDIFIRYINLFCSFLSILNIYKIMNELEISKQTKRRSSYFLFLMPISFFFSVVILREIMVIFFLSFSLLYFFRFHKNKKVINVLVSFLFLLVSSIFHAGIILLGVGYVYTLLNTKSKYKIIYFFVVGLILLFSLKFGSFFFAKFQSASADTVVNMANHRKAFEGGSTYLTNVSINNIGDVLRYMPLKVFYFLFSPTPNLFRGIVDVFTFLFDSVLYFYLIFYILRNFKVLSKGNLRVIVTGLLIGFFVAVFVFSIGTFNAGTAIRHRHKLFFILILIYSVIFEKREIIRKE